MNAQMEGYAIEHASLRARLLSVTAGFPSDAVEDARQDLLLDYVRRLPKYDSTRGDRDGFMRGVMRNHVTVLIARRSRRIRHEVLADDLAAPQSDGVVEIVHCEDPTNALQVSLDVQRVLLQLPRHLQHLAALLPDMPIAEVCVAIGKSRSRTHQMIREIRAALTVAGLKTRHALPSQTGARCGRTPADPPRQQGVGR